MKYRKKPIVVEAKQFVDDASAEEIVEWSGGAVRLNDALNEDGKVWALWVDTEEGQMRALVGDYILKGVEGEFYPCKSHIFHKTYEKIG